MAGCAEKVYTRVSHLTKESFYLFFTFTLSFFFCHPVSKNPNTSLICSLSQLRLQGVSLEVKKKSYEKESHSIELCQSTEIFLTAPLIYCNLQFPNTKIQQFLLKSIRWQFQYTKKQIIYKIIQFKKNFIQKIYKSFVPSIIFKLSGLKTFTIMIFQNIY